MAMGKLEVFLREQATSGRQMPRYPMGYLPVPPMEAARRKKIESDSPLQRLLQVWLPQHSSLAVSYLQALWKTTKKLHCILNARMCEGTNHGQQFRDQYKYKVHKKLFTLLIVHNFWIDSIMVMFLSSILGGGGSHPPNENIGGGGKHRFAPPPPK